MRIAHVSDVHFGRITHPGVVGALVDTVHASGVDLVAISGDLTQRARRREYRAAAALVEAFEPPVVVVPGNHDVHPWWHPVRRLARPLRRYRRYIDRALVQPHVQEGAAVLGVNSAHGWTVKGGRLEPRARRAMRTFFETHAEATTKVLVLHHHLVPLPGLPRHDVLRDAGSAFLLAARLGVDLVLCGHLHVAHVEAVTEPRTGRTLLIASAGTATSNRGRAQNRRANLFNLIDADGERLHIDEYLYHAATERFHQHRHFRYDRATQALTASAPVREQP